MFEEYLTFGGQANGASGAIEEDPADFAFEIEHLFADRGLRDVEFSSCGGEASEVCNCCEIAEMAKFHDSSL